MKKINFKLVLIVVLVLGSLLSFVFNTKVAAQSVNDFKIYTTGYSILSAQSFVFSGYYSGNVNKEDITTYFEFEKADTNTSTNINLSSSDLLKLFLKSEKDIQKTIEIKRELNPEVNGVFHISPELNLFSTYYFRAVGYFNNKPEEKFYGDVMTIRTGYIPIGYTYPYTYNGIQNINKPFVQTEILSKTFWVKNITENSADISGTISGTNFANLKLKVEYGEEKFDFTTDLLNFDNKGNFTVNLKDLKTETKYYFRVFDTTNKLKPSFENSFITTKKVEINKLGVKANIVVYNESPTSVLFRLNVYNANPQDLELRVEYGEGNLDNVSFSEIFKPEYSGNASLLLNNLKPGTLYKYRLIEIKDHSVLSDDLSFTTENEDKASSPILNTDSDSYKKVSGGLVPCGTERDGENKITNPCGFSHIFALIKNVMDYLFLGFILPVSAILFAYAGFELVTSGGDTEKKSKAKSIFINVLIGLVVSLGAFLIVKTVLNIVGFNSGAGINMFGF